MAIKASFIVPTRNRAEILKVSLPLMLAQEQDSNAYEVVVVSDGSNDSTGEVVAAQESSRIQFSELPEQSGPAAARNRAIELAGGKTLIFVDDDSLIAPDFLRHHLKHHGNGPGVRIVTGPIIDVHRVPDVKNPPKAGLFDRHWNPFPTGNASVDKSHVVAAGGFDEAFKTYGWEDPEFFVRLATSGVSRKFEYSAPIFHFKPDAQTAPLSARLKLERMRGANGALFYAKHPTFAVGFQTKQLRAFGAIDRLFDRILDLQGKVDDAVNLGREPDNRLLRTLIVLHAEIEAGRQARRKLSRQHIDPNEE